MEGEIMEYITIGVIIAVVFNMILVRVRKIIKLIKEKNDRANTPIPDTRVYHVPDPIVTARPPRPNVTRQNSGVQPDLPHHRNPRKTGTPPPLPSRTNMVRREPEDFPRCPVCRCSNKPGQQQVVFWDTMTRRWRCHRGHSFSS